MIGGRLTMRASVERNLQTGTDPHNNPLPPDFQPLHAALPCFAWSPRSRELQDATKVARIEDLRALFAKDADLQAGDEITEIRNRAGAVVIEGRLKVEGAPQFKHNHIEASLQRIG
jgi:hypothetical protein